MSFHYVTGMGTDADGDQKWARDKGGAERTVAALAEGSGLRTFGYHSAFVRPTSEQANVLIYVLEALLRPGKLVITGDDLGGSMLDFRYLFFAAVFLAAGLTLSFRLKKSVLPENFLEKEVN